MSRELVADLHVTEAHDWVAREGRVWVFVVVRIVIGGKPYSALPFLLREGDEGLRDEP